MMESYWFSLITGYAVLPAALIGALRYGSVHLRYRPFIWIIWLGTINEILSTLLIRNNQGNALNSNLYILPEALLFVYLFYRWKQMSRAVMLCLSVFLTIIWMADNLFWNTLRDFNAPFRILSSFTLGFLAIDRINKLITNQKNLYRDGSFLISVAVLLFFCYKTFFEVFYAVPLKMRPEFYRALFAILMWVNLISNILYAFAILCLPTKPVFTLRSSQA